MTEQQDFIEQIRLLCVRLDLLKRLRDQFPNFKARCPPMVTVVENWDQHMLAIVYLDVTIPSTADARKAYQSPWKEPAYIQSLTAGTAIDRREYIMRRQDMLTILDARCNNAMKRMQPVDMYQSCSNLVQLGPEDSIDAILSVKGHVGDNPFYQGR